MAFELKLAVRYLGSARLQTGLLVSGVAVGVVVFTFIAALMNGLSGRLTEDITGNVAHVTLEPEPRSPRAFLVSPGKRSLFAVQPGHDVKPVIRTYRFVLDVAAKMRGIRVAVPEVFGNGTLARGEKNVAVAVTGVEQKNADEIAPLGKSMIRGRLDLGVGNVIIGSRLADELAVDVGERLILRAVRPASSGAAASAEAVVTALENVLMPAYGAHSSVDSARQARALALLDRVGLSERISFRPAQLSGGQKQRVAVARALIMKPELVLADEPTGNLDRANSDQVIALLRELSRDEGTAFLISTHDESIARRCDRILSLEDGRLGAAAPSKVT